MPELRVMSGVWPQLSLRLAPCWDPGTWPGLSPSPWASLCQARISLALALFPLYFLWSFWNPQFFKPSPKGSTGLFWKTHVLTCCKDSNVGQRGVWLFPARAKLVLSDDLHGVYLRTRSCVCSGVWMLPGEAKPGPCFWRGTGR